MRTNQESLTTNIRREATVLIQERSRPNSSTARRSRASAPSPLASDGGWSHQENITMDEENVSGTEVLQAPELEVTTSSAAVLHVRRIWYHDAGKLERQRVARRSPYRTRWLTLSGGQTTSHFLVAAVVDVHSGDLDILTLEPVEEGRVYTAAGEIEVRGHSVVISGTFRVTTCRTAVDGMYEVELTSLEDETAFHDMCSTTEEVRS